MKFNAKDMRHHDMHQRIQLPATCSYHGYHNSDVPSGKLPFSLLVFRLAIFLLWKTLFLLKGKISCLTKYTPFKCVSFFQLPTQIQFLFCLKFPLERLGFKNIFKQTNSVETDPSPNHSKSANLKVFYVWPKSF